MSTTDSHPSARWTQRAFAAERGTQPADLDQFAGLMVHDRFPRSSAYDPSWVWTNHMGPNVLWLTEYLTEALDLQPGMRVLDMGCGTAMSSIFLAREFGAEVWAADLWIPAHRDLWQASDRIEVTSAEMLDGGWELWRRGIDAGMAWDGSGRPGGDAVMLDANPELGFTRIVALRLP